MSIDKSRVPPVSVFEPAPYRMQNLARPILWFVAALLSLGVGFALVRVSPLLIIGGLVAVAGTLLIMFHPFVGLLLYLLMFILRPGEMYPALTAMHLERIIGLVTLAALLFDMQRRGTVRLDGSAQTRALLIFVGSIVLSIPFSYWPGGSVSTLVEMLKILVFYILVVHLVDSPKRMHVFVWAYIILVLYLDTVSLARYYTGRAAFAQGIDRATGANSAAGNANELGTTLACILPLLILLACRERALWRRLLAGASGLTCLWGMVLTGSRASLVGFLAGMSYLWWRSGRRLLVGIVGLALILAAYFVLPEQYQGRYSTITRSHLDESSRGRVTTWMTGLKMVLDRPLFGVGAGCFGVAHATAYSPGARRNWLESHSLYLQVLAELGIVGAVAFFAFVIQFMRLNRQVARRLKQVLPAWPIEYTVVTGLFAGFVVLLVSGVFGHSLYRRTWYIYAGLGLAVWRMIKDAPLPSVDHRHGSSQAAGSIPHAGS